MSDETQKTHGRQVAERTIFTHGRSVMMVAGERSVICVEDSPEDAMAKVWWMQADLASLIDAERADAVKGFPLGDLSELHESQEIANRAVRSDITYLSERIDRIESPDTFRRDLAAKIYLRHMGCEGVGSFRSCAERSIRGADALIAALKGEVKP